MANERYSIRLDKKTKKYDIFLSGFTPMYCGTYDTKKECKTHIKEQKNIITTEKKVQKLKANGWNAYE